MDRAQFITQCNATLKTVRTEHAFSQEKMAVILGISKKTLVEIEKGRSSLGWTGSVALCAIFCDSGAVSEVFGNAVDEIIHALAFEGSERYPHTMGGKVWWQTIMENENYLIEQNIISQHYRLLTKGQKRVSSSLNLEDLTIIFNQNRRCPDKEGETE